MRDKESGLTPKEYAVLLATGWIENMIKGRTHDLSNLESERFAKATRKQLIKIHNKLALSHAGKAAGIFDIEEES